MKIRTLFSFLAPVFLALPAFAEAPTYDIDHSHTRIFFRLDHAGFSKLVGEFKDYEGYFTFDESVPEVSSVEVALKVRSIETSSKELDGKLLGKQFFNEKEFPKITFRSAKVKVTGKNTGTLDGDLTMHGITKPVTFDVTFNKGGEFMGTYKVGFSAKAVVKRSDFALAEYVPMVSDEVAIEVQTEGVRRDVKPKPGK